MVAGGGAVGQRSSEGKRQDLTLPSPLIGRTSDWTRLMPTVGLAAAETRVSQRADLRLRYLFRPTPNRGVGIQPLAWLTGTSAHGSKVAYFCIGAPLPGC